VFLPKSVQETTVLGVFSIPALVMFAAAAASYYTTKPEVHESNDFNFGPGEGGGLPVRGHLPHHDPGAADSTERRGWFKISSPMQYYFSTGALSAFLDNAPTYLSFLAASMGHEQSLRGFHRRCAEALPPRHAQHLIAISLGAVFFGAGSYIGNGTELHGQGHR
jgi:hypothetical protein